MVAKTSSPLYDRSGAAGTRAPEELKLDGRLLQRNQDQSQNKGGVQQQENKKRTHRCATRGTSLASSSSLSTKATMALAEKGQKYSVKDKNKQRKDRAY